MADELLAYGQQGNKKRYRDMGDGSYAEVVAVTYPTETQRASKTVTFDGAAGSGAVGAVDLFTVTGSVEILRLAPLCTTDLVEDPVPGSATLALGVTGDPDLFIAPTAAETIDEGYWLSDSLVGLPGAALPAALTHIAVSADLIATVATSAIDEGEIVFDVLWRALSEDGELVAVADA